MNSFTTPDGHGGCKAVDKLQGGIGQKNVGGASKTGDRIFNNRPRQANLNNNNGTPKTGDRISNNRPRQTNLNNNNGTSKTGDRISNNRPRQTDLKNNNATSTTGNRLVNNRPGPSQTNRQKTDFFRRRASTPAYDPHAVK